MKETLVAPLLAGLASHHAGCLPAWKALVERCFQQGLLKVRAPTHPLTKSLVITALSPQKTYVILLLLLLLCTLSVLAQYLLQPPSFTAEGGVCNVGLWQYLLSFSSPPPCPPNLTFALLSLIPIVCLSSWIGC